MNQLKIDDFLEYRSLSNIRYSPDGSNFLFSVTKPDILKNAYDRRIFCSNGVETFEVASSQNPDLSFWENDSNIIFAAIRKESDKEDSTTSFYRFNINHKIIEHAFKIPVSVNKIIPLGNLYIVSAGIETDHADLYLYDSEKKEKLRKEKEYNSDCIVADEIPFWFDGKGDISKKRNALFVFDPQTGRIERLTSPLFETIDFITANGKLYFFGEEYSQCKKYKSIIYCWDSDKTTCLWSNPDSWIIVGIEHAFNEIIVLATEEHRTEEFENPSFYILDENQKDLRLFLHNDDSIGKHFLTDILYGNSRNTKGTDEKLYFFKTMKGNIDLYSLDPDGYVSAIVTKEGATVDFDVNCHGDLLVSGLYDMKLHEIYAWKENRLQQLTHFNDAALAGKYVAPCINIVAHSNGWDVNGWVMEPKDFDPTKKYPSILNIHGGPKCSYSPIFFNEMQVWANQGYFVYFCNPFGSEGVCKEYGDLRGRFGTIDYDTLMDFTQKVADMYPQIDADRMAVTGGSYGGYMTNWIISHTDKFCAAATQRCISNWISFCGTADIGFDWGYDQAGGVIPDDYEKMWDASPLKYAKNIKTPTLFIHSDMDYRCPLEQAQQLFTYLCLHGIPTRLVRFKGENHSLSRVGKPVNRLRRLKEITDWFNKYTK